MIWKQNKHEGKAVIKWLEYYAHPSVSLRNPFGNCNMKK